MAFNADAAGLVFNVKAHGAKGDGTTNDTAAIKRAITAAGVSGRGGTVSFPPGIYIVNDSLRVGANMAFVGSGGPATSVIKATTPWVGPDADIIAMEADNGRLENIYVQADTHTTAVCIHVEGFTCRIIGCKTQGGSVGLLNEKNETQVLHTLFHSASSYGVQNKHVDLTCFDVSTHLCGVGYRASGIGPGGAATLVHFHSIGSTSHGFYIDEADFTFMWGCEADTSGEHGFFITNTDGVSATDCWSFNSSQASAGAFSNWRIGGGTANSYVGCKATQSVGTNLHDWDISSASEATMQGCTGAKVNLRADATGYQIFGGGSAFVKAAAAKRAPIVTSTYSVLAGDEDILASGTFTVTLESAVTAGRGRKVTVKNTGAGTITMAAVAGAVDPNALTIQPGVAVTYISDGTNWWAI